LEFSLFSRGRAVHQGSDFGGDFRELFCSGESHCEEAGTEDGNEPHRAFSFHGQRGVVGTKQGSEDFGCKHPNIKAIPKEQVRSIRSHGEVWIAE
jgi:hypothetical protein